MKWNDRERELLYKPVFNGAPISWAREYFNGRLKRFRNEHPEFNEFLIEINKLIKDDEYPNITRFINGDSDTNWISPKNCLFDIFIKLFNLCLSPKQAYEYINECHDLYVSMLNSDYTLCDELETSIQKSRWDGKNTMFIDVDMKPIKEFDNDIYHYWFHISTSLIFVEDPLNDIDSNISKIELRGSHQKLKDALTLFEYHQDREPLLTKVFNSMIKQLEERGVIKEIKQESLYGLIIHHYRYNGL